MSGATLIAMHYEKDNASLESCVKEMVASAKSHHGDRFRVYRPVSEKASDVAVLVFPDSGLSANASGPGAFETHLGGDKALEMLKAAKPAVKALHHHKVTLSHDVQATPPPYIVVLGIQYDPANYDQAHAAGQAVLKAQQQHGQGKLVVITSDSKKGEALVAIAADKADAAEGTLNQARPEVADVVAAFHKAVKHIEIATLQYDANLSHP